MAAADPRGLVSHFDELIGTEWLSDDPEHARVRIELRDELRQPVGLLHGGVMSSLVESVCSRATALAVMGEGMMAMRSTPAPATAAAPPGSGTPRSATRTTGSAHWPR